MSNSDLRFVFEDEERQQGRLLPQTVGGGLASKKAFSTLDVRGQQYNHQGCNSIDILSTFPNMPLITREDSLKKFQNKYLCNLLGQGIVIYLI